MHAVLELNPQLKLNLAFGFSHTKHFNIHLRRRETLLKTEFA